jgi:hypothetical protein
MKILNIIPINIPVKSTDRRLINATKKANARISVQNPLIWLTEVFYDRES